MTQIAGSSGNVVRIYGGSYNDCADDEGQSREDTSWDIFPKIANTEHFDGKKMDCKTELSAADSQTMMGHPIGEGTFMFDDVERDTESEEEDETDTDIVRIDYSD